jgi:hypothetical protein
MTREGFSPVIAVIIGLVVLIGGWYLFGAFSQQSKFKEIDDRINAIHFSANIQKTQCAGGGVDTSEWCSYTVESAKAAVIKDLASSGYTVSSNSGNTATLTGGNPKMTINLDGSNNQTSLEAKILEGGKTI